MDPIPTEIILRDLQILDGSYSYWNIVSDLQILER